MTLRVGRLLPGAVAVGLGVSGAQRGFAVFPQGEEPVIAKRLPLLEIAAEGFCAELARSHGLPCPEPVLLVDGEDWLFGSIDLGYPNLAKLLGLGAALDEPRKRLLCALLASWAELPKVASFDEWIDNRDRNLGNLLWLNAKGFALIDHGKTLGIDQDYPDGNKLLALQLACLTNDELGRGRLKRAILGVLPDWDLVMASPAKEAATQVQDEETADRFWSLLARRLAILRDLIIARWPSNPLQF